MLTEYLRCCMSARRIRAGITMCWNPRAAIYGTLQVASSCVVLLRRAEPAWGRFRGAWCIGCILRGHRLHSESLESRGADKAAGKHGMLNPIWRAVESRRSHFGVVVGLPSYWRESGSIHAKLSFKGIHDRTSPTFFAEFKPF